MNFSSFAKIVAIGLGLAIFAAPASAQYPTIVGEWHAEEFPQDCGTPFAVYIGPMHYAEEAMVCSFDDVARDGWQVTWNGSCSDGNESLATRVVANENGGRLTLAFNGMSGWTGLRRCGAR